MRFTIVTLSFNQCNYLARAIESVLAQRADVDLEYVVVDPGSTDGSRALIESYSDRIDRVVLEPDRGPADGLNAGFRHARGDILGYVNADDYLLEGALARVHARFEAHPETDVLYGDGLLVDNTDRVLRIFYSDSFSLRRVAYGTSIVVQQSTFFRRSAFERIPGFNIANRVAWDGELLVDLALSGAVFRRTRDVYGAFRVHAESITGSGRLAQLNVQHSDAMFRRIMGRPRRSTDRVIALAHRIWKHLSRPRASWERIARGPIFGRYRA